LKSINPKRALVNSPVTPSSKLPNLFYGNNNSSNENIKEVNHNSSDTIIDSHHCQSFNGWIYALFKYCLWFPVYILRALILSRQNLRKQATIQICCLAPFYTPHFVGLYRFG